MSTTHHAPPLADREEVVPLTSLGGAGLPPGELELVAHLVGPTWLVSWRWRGLLLLGVEPYRAGSDEEN